MPFSIESVAREYVNKRFSQASVPEKEKLVKDWVNKVPDSQALVKDFKERAGDPSGKEMVDIGFGNGGVSIAFALAGAKMSGVDVEKELQEIAQAHAKSFGAQASFFLCDGQKLPFADDIFDYAISVSVLEHTDCPAGHLAEILRVVKPGGRCYLAFPNKLWPKETHTGVWLLTYLPAFCRPAALRFLKRSPLAANNLHFYTYFDLRRLIERVCHNGFYWHILPEQGRAQGGFKKIIKKILEVFGLPYKAFLSHILVILEKKHE